MKKNSFVFYFFLQRDFVSSNEENLILILFWIYIFGRGQAKAIEQVDKEMQNLTEKLVHILQDLKI